MKRNRGQYTFICPKCKYRIGKRETNEELKQDINTDMDVTGQQNQRSGKCRKTKEEKVGDNAIAIYIDRYT